MEGGKKHQKSYFDVLGICCPSEVPLIERILNSKDGIVSVSVIVTTRTVIVVHDADLISQLQIVKALNQARLEATVKASGDGRRKMVWPTPYTVVCGVLLLVSFLNPFYGPLKWFAVAAAAVGMPPTVLRSLAAIRRLTVDINILLLIAVAGSIALGEYWEAGIIVFLFSIAGWLESRATYKATEVMSSLLSMAPQKAILAESGLVVDAQDVKLNTILAVKAGEVIPIDGVVVEGKCEVDESSLTGESFPVAKQPQSLVWAGTHNINGYINVKTTALAEHSTVAKMMKLVEEAQNNKSKINKMIDSCAMYYTPVVVLASAAVAVVPVAVGAHNQRYWFHLALVLLVCACPCALVLSTPVATFCALSRAATTGLLIKGGEFLEALAKTKVVAFDKTGTITKGDFAVMDLRPVKDNICMENLLYWVSSIESKSNHPMAAALVEHAQSKSIEPKPENVTEFQILPGEGIYGEIDGKNIHVGNRRIAARAGCETVPNLEEKTNGVTVGYVFSGVELIGTFSLSDGCRTGAAEAIRELKLLGIKTAMLTGDSEAATSYIQNQLGNTIDFIHAELRPKDKVRIIKELKSKEGSTVMVGDGMNDAPALTAADVGISMGISGSAVAIETSHVTLMSNDVCKIPEAIRFAKKTSRKIIENIIVSVTTKAAIVVLAFSGHPLLWAAVLADVGTSLLVIVNSMLLLQKTRKSGRKCCRSSSSSNQHAQKHHHAQQCHREQQHLREHQQHGDHHHHGEHHANDQCGMKESCCKSKVTNNSCCSQDMHPIEVNAKKEQETCSSKSCCDELDCHAKEASTSTSYVHEGDFSHSCSSQETQLQRSLHEHSITIDCGEKHHKENDHSLAMLLTLDVHGDASCREKNILHDCCKKGAISGPVGGNHFHVGHGRDSACSGGTCSSSRKHVELDKMESGDCCKSYITECSKKEVCCKHSKHHLSEIITE